MENLRLYGEKPYSIAILHGGPGGPGQVFPIAKRLSLQNGVLEPLQTANSVDGQVKELEKVLRENTERPVILIGFSWGAMLSFIFTARHPKYVKKLIMVSSGVLEDKYASGIMETRFNRLSESEKLELNSLLDLLNDEKSKDKNVLFAKVKKFVDKTDKYDPIACDDDVLEYQHDIFQAVWKDAQKLRKSSAFLELGKSIKCPVVAIHGDYDPHPFEGIKRPLEKVIKNFRFILLENCGHYPWHEKKCAEKFYEILQRELLVF